MDDNKKRQLLTGLFVVSGAVLLLVLLFFLGLSDCFADKVTLRTGFTESVQGLSRGSAVKYRGVQIGTVKDISILVNENLIQVDMQIEPKYFQGHRRSRYTESEFNRFMHAEIQKKGLRARLEMLGITGMKYIDFDYFARPGSTVPEAPKFTGVQALFVPSVTSQMKDISATLTIAVDRISRIRFEQISEQLEQSLTGLGQLLNSPEIRSTIARINDTAENLETGTRNISNVLNENRLRSMAELLEKNLVALDQLQKSLINTTAEAKIPDTAASFRRAMNTLSDSKLELSGVLMKFSQTLEAIRVAAETLSDDPASLLRGKQKNPARQ